MSFIEQKYQMGTDDGYEIVWDISSLLEDIINSNYPICNRCIFEFDEINNSCGNIEYAMNTNLENPCIVAELTENTKILIDGNHRLFKAKQLGVENILCYILPLEYHKKFILNYNPSIYEKVVLFYEKTRTDIKRANPK